MSLKPYPEYRDSGFDWLGALPTGWEGKRLKFGFDLQKRPISSDMEIVTAFRDGEVTLRKNRRLAGYTEGDKQIGYQGIEPGDLVIHAMDAFAGAIGVSDSRGKSTPVYNVCRPKSGVQARFFAFALRHLALTGYIESLSKGIRERSTDFRWADAKNVIVPFPPQNEQRAIVGYLDRETAEIDAFIADQEELIALMGERRTATITRAVTKGLHEDAPMNTGVLDDVDAVPFHWSVSRLKWGITKIESGTSVNAQDVPVSGRDEVGVLKTSSVYTGEFDPSKNKTVFTEDLHRVTCLVRANTLIVSRMNTPQLVAAAGRPSRDETNIYLPDRLWQVYFHESWETQFVHFWTQTRLYRTQVEAVCMGTSSSMQNIGQDDFRNFVLHLPPRDEQRSIVAYLLVEMAEIDAAIADAREAIALSKERRAAVISAAVTGKIDVRGALAPATRKMEAEPVGVA